jgi:hypothetical protein
MNRITLVVLTLLALGIVIITASRHRNAQAAEPTQRGVWKVVVSLPKTNSTPPKATQTSWTRPPN